MTHGSRARVWAVGMLAAGMMAGASGCGRGSQGLVANQSGINAVMGERLGARVSQDIESGGDVILLHVSSTPGETDQWIKGLKKALSKNSLVVIGREDLPTEAAGAMGGFPALHHALQQHPSAAAIVTTLPVGSFERPRFAKDHPPIYALGWSYLPDSIHLFKGKHLVAGVFEQPNPPPAGDSSLSAEERFDRNYVLVTAENLVEQVRRY